MKNLKILLIIVCIAFIDVEAKPSVAPISFTITRKGFSSSYILRCTGAKTGIVFVTVHNDEGYLMIQKKARQPELPSFLVDFTAFPDGRYKVRITDGLKSCTLIVHHSANMSPNYTNTVCPKSEAQCYSAILTLHCFDDVRALA
ncbi:hypothetical protein [Pseudochryseolinea flava]|uniref:Uncharacterized protein n=1 Tax=Pseudochryseolinea flava TaxID=2059302 RepID=A0A364Y4T6_9BACT|nr:hypothetical protein [Pseudochryseolinea flava]RAW02008.1 hypothetical protein DQQ10_05475 [Pseudochryseolinea flava]